MDCLTLKTKALRSFETLESLYLTAQRNVQPRRCKFKNR